MALIESSSYRAPSYLFNGHVETIVPGIFRKVLGLTYTRTRLELADGDFLDLDWLQAHSRNLVIISHGLEGSSERHYARGMAKFFFNRGWDALAWNCRSCGGDNNRLPRFYHHGDTADLSTVIDEAIRMGYKTIALVGFSMGGSFSLKYLGEKGPKNPTELIGAATFSVPCDLGSSSRMLDQPHMSFYRKRFIGKLGRKLLDKSIRFPTHVSMKGFKDIKTFEEFHARYTAPLHGFSSVDDFYQQASLGEYLNGVAVPSLIVNAKNDPMLPAQCYPEQIARGHRFVSLEIPSRGGHVGFSLAGKQENWMEQRAFEFISSISC